MFSINPFDAYTDWAAVELRCAELDAERAVWRQGISAPEPRARHTVGVPAVPTRDRIPAVTSGRAPPRDSALIGRSPVRTGVGSALSAAQPQHVGTGQRAFGLTDCAEDGLSEHRGDRLGQRRRRR